MENNRSVYEKILGFIVVWFIVFIIAFQIITIYNLQIIENKLVEIETKNYNNSVEIQNIKIELKEYQAQTERLFDQNLKLITEGGWNEFIECEN